MKLKNWLLIISSVSCVTVLADTFQSKKSNPYDPFPTRCSQMVDEICYEYIIDENRAMIFDWDYSSTGYGYAVNAVSAPYSTGGTLAPSQVKGVLVIPDTLGGLPVVKIGEKAFEGCNNLTAVTIPEGVTQIAWYSFAELEKLETVVFPSTLTDMNASAFYDCSSLKYLKFESEAMPWSAGHLFPKATDIVMPVAKISKYFAADKITNLVFTAKGGRNLTRDHFGMDRVSGTEYRCEKIMSVSFLGSFDSVATNTFSGVLPALREVCVTKVSRSMIQEALLASGRDDVVVKLIDESGNPAFDTPPEITPTTGTTFSQSLTVSMTCADEEGTIRYTTDGSDPTEDSPIYRRFRVYGKTIVKARLFFPNGDMSDVVTAEYALGRCSEPTIVSVGGETFYHSGNVVTIGYDSTEGVVRYTINGSEPTAESPIYAEPFAIDASTVVKAKAFSDSYFDSAVVTATLTREWETVATPVIAAAESFTGAKTKVQIACATEGATIRYTLNGSDPNSHAKKYTGPFYVTEGCTVKAYAVLADYTNSEIAAKTITKVWGIGDSVALPDQQFATSGDAQWVDASGEAMKSGEIADEQRSILSTTFVGKGALAFKWKISCEEDEEKHDWDHAAFFVDGVEIARQDGQTDWLEITHSIETEGEHAVQWVYVKDDAESDGEDCMWLKDVVWMPEMTQTTEVPVPTAWLKAKYPSLGDYYFDYEEQANELAANGVNTVWECYVIGLEPTAADARFVALIEMVDGVPKVTWLPDLGAERVYRVLGARGLGDAAPEAGTAERSETAEGRGTGLGDAAGETHCGTVWEIVTEETKGNYKFFKVVVEMP